MVKNPLVSSGDVGYLGSISVSGRSPGGGHRNSSILPGKSHEHSSLVGCSPWGRKSQTQLSD